MSNKFVDPTRPPPESMAIPCPSLSYEVYVKNGIKSPEQKAAIYGKVVKCWFDTVIMNKFNKWILKHRDCYTSSPTFCSGSQ